MRPLHKGRSVTLEEQLDCNRKHDTSEDWYPVAITQIVFVSSTCVPSVYMYLSWKVRKPQLPHNLLQYRHIVPQQVLIQRLSIYMYKSVECGMNHCIYFHGSIHLLMLFSLQIFSKLRSQVWCYNLFPPCVSLYNKFVNRISEVKLKCFSTVSDKGDNLWYQGQST